MVLNASIEVGRRLTEAKAKLPHGSWGEYLKNEVDYSPSQAQNLMRVFREYGSDQQSLFGGEAKSQTFGRLTFSQALSLLVIPDEDEREIVVTMEIDPPCLQKLFLPGGTGRASQPSARACSGLVRVRNDRSDGQRGGSGP